MLSNLAIVLVGVACDYRQVIEASIATRCTFFLVVDGCEVCLDVQVEGGVLAAFRSLRFWHLVTARDSFVLDRLGLDSTLAKETWRARVLTEDNEA